MLMFKLKLIQCPKPQPIKSLASALTTLSIRTSSYKTNFFGAVHVAKSHLLASPDIIRFHAFTASHHLSALVPNVSYAFHFLTRHRDSIVYTIRLLRGTNNVILMDSQIWFFPRCRPPRISQSSNILDISSVSKSSSHRAHVAVFGMQSQTTNNHLIHQFQ